MKKTIIKTDSLEKMLSRLEEIYEKREQYADNRSEKWYDSGKYEIFEDESMRLQDVIDQLDYLIEVININNDPSHEGTSHIDD